MTHRLSNESHPWQDLKILINIKLQLLFNTLQPPSGKGPIPMPVGSCRMSWFYLSFSYIHLKLPCHNLNRKCCERILKISPKNFTQILF